MLDENVKPAAEAEAPKTEPTATPAAPAAPVAAPASAPPSGAPPRREGSGGPRRDFRDKEGGPRREGSGPRRNGPGGPRKGKRQYFRKRKVCKFCVEKLDWIDYKKAESLREFVQDRGKILPRRITGTCSRHQRWLHTAIMRARNIALLPFGARA